LSGLARAQFSLGYLPPARAPVPSAAIVTVAYCDSFVQTVKIQLGGVSPDRFRGKWRAGLENSAARRDWLAIFSLECF